MQTDERAWTRSKEKISTLWLLILVPPPRCVRCSVGHSACQCEECFIDHVKVHRVSKEFRLRICDIVIGLKSGAFCVANKSNIIRNVACYSIYYVMHYLIVTVLYCIARTCNPLCMIVNLIECRLSNLAPFCYCYNGSLWKGWLLLWSLHVEC